MSYVSTVVSTYSAKRAARTATDVTGVKVVLLDTLKMIDRLTLQSQADNPLRIRVNGVKPKTKKRWKEGQNGNSI